MENVQTELLRQLVLLYMSKQKWDFHFPTTLTTFDENDKSKEVIHQRFEILSTGKPISNLHNHAKKIYIGVLLRLKAIHSCSIYMLCFENNKKVVGKSHNDTKKSTQNIFVQYLYMYLGIIPRSLASRYAYSLITSGNLIVILPKRK